MEEKLQIGDMVIHCNHVVDAVHSEVKLFRNIQEISVIQDDGNELKYSMKNPGEHGRGGGSYGRWDLVLVSDVKEVAMDLLIQKMRWVLKQEEQE